MGRTPALGDVATPLTFQREKEKESEREREGEDRDSRGKERACACAEAQRDQRNLTLYTLDVPKTLLRHIWK